MHSRHYVIKTSGVFTKSAKILEIYDKAVIFVNPDLYKNPKDREIFLFKDSIDFNLSEKNDKEIYVKAQKQNFTLTCFDRPALLTELFYYKVFFGNNATKCK